MYTNCINNLNDKFDFYRHIFFILLNFNFLVLFSDIHHLLTHLLNNQHKTKNLKKKIRKYIGNSYACVVYHRSKYFDTVCIEL